MSAKPDCYGCEGRGWIVLLVRERLQPYKDQTGTIHPTCGMQTREYMAADCPVCKGSGVAPRLDRELAEFARAQ